MNKQPPQLSSDVSVQWPTTPSVWAQWLWAASGSLTNSGAIASVPRDWLSKVTRSKSPPTDADILAISLVPGLSEAVDMLRTLPKNSPTLHKIAQSAEPSSDQWNGIMLGLLQTSLSTRSRPEITKAALQWLFTGRQTEHRNAVSDHTLWRFLINICDETNTKPTRDLLQHAVQPKSDKAISNGMSIAVQLGRSDWVAALWTIFTPASPSKVKPINPSLPTDATDLWSHIRWECDPDEKTATSLSAHLGPELSKDQSAAYIAMWTHPVALDFLKVTLPKHALKTLGTAAILSKTPHGQEVFSVLWDIARSQFLNTPNPEQYLKLLQNLSTPPKSPHSNAALKHLLMDPDRPDVHLAEIIQAVVVGARHQSDIDRPVARVQRVQILLQTITLQDLQPVWKELMEANHWETLNSLSEQIPADVVSEWTIKAQSELLQKRAPFIHSALTKAALTEHVSPDVKTSRPPKM